MQYFFSRKNDNMIGKIYLIPNGQNIEDEHVIEYRINVHDISFRGLSEAKIRLKSRIMVQSLLGYYECMPKDSFDMLHEYLENCPIQDKTNPNWQMNLIYMGDASGPSRFRRHRKGSVTTIDIKYEQLECMSWQYDQD